MSPPSGRRLRGAIAAIAVGLTVVMGAVAPADASPPTIQSDVTVELDRDGQTRGRSALAWRRRAQSEVSAVNRAYAGARCDDCRAVAVSFQVVLAHRGPTQITPDNTAIAVNEDCQRCETVAIAYQFVVAGSGRSHLTPAGHMSIARVRGDAPRAQPLGPPCSRARRPGRRSGGRRWPPCSRPSCGPFRPFAARCGATRDGDGAPVSRRGRKPCSTGRPTHRSSCPTSMSARAWRLGSGSRRSRRPPVHSPPRHAPHRFARSPGRTRRRRRCPARCT